MARKDKKGKNDKSDKIKKEQKRTKDPREDAIKINDRFCFKRTLYCWELYETNAIGRLSHKRFYSTLLDLCNAVMDISCDEANSMVDIRDVVKTVRDEISDILEWYTFTDEEILTAVSKKK